MSDITKEIRETEIKEKVTEVGGFRCEGPCGQIYYDDEGVEKYEICANVDIPDKQKIRGAFNEFTNFVTFWDTFQTDFERAVGYRTSITALSTSNELTFGQAVEHWMEEVGGPRYDRDKHHYDAAIPMQVDNPDVMFEIELPIDIEVEAKKVICEYCWESLFE